MLDVRLITTSRAGAGTLTAVTVTFVTILGVLAVVASSLTTSATRTVIRASRRHAALRAARAAVSEAMVVFDANVIHGRSPRVDASQDRLQVLFESMGPVVGFVDPGGDRILPPPSSEPMTLDGRLTSPFWHDAFRRDPVSFHGVYWARWAVRVLGGDEEFVDVSPVDIRVVHRDLSPDGRKVSGTLVFRGQCSMKESSGGTIVRRYEVRRRFIVNHGASVSPVRFLPAPLGIFVDGSRSAGGGR